MPTPNTNNRLLCVFSYGSDLCGLCLKNPYGRRVAYTDTHRIRGGFAGIRAGYARIRTGYAQDTRRIREDTRRIRAGYARIRADSHAFTRIHGSAGIRRIREDTRRIRAGYARLTTR